MSTSTEAPPRTGRQVIDDRIKHVAELAKKAFAEHRVEPLWVGVPFGPGLIEARAWLCGKPDRSEYHFTLYSVPGRLILCGDLGTLVVERTRDMLAWARGSIGDVNYFAEKVPREIETKEYDPDLVRAWIHETDQEVLEDNRSEKFVKEWIGELRAALLSAVEDGEAAVSEAYYGSGIYGGGPPDWTNWRHRFLWQREAIKWFLANHGGAA